MDWQLDDTTDFIRLVSPDIGGGYANLDQYSTILDYFDKTDKDVALFAEKQQLRNYYNSNRISEDENIVLKNTYDQYTETTVDPYLGGYFSIIQKREVNRDPNYQAPRDRMWGTS